MAIKCGQCGHTHQTVAEVRDCHAVHGPALVLQRPTDRQVAFANSLLSQVELKPYELETLQAQIASATKFSISQVIDDLQEWKRKRPKKAAEASAIGKLVSSVHIKGKTPEWGTYTVVNDKAGWRRTLRFHKAQHGYFAGQVLVKLLTGSDNNNDYTAIGVCVPEGIKLFAKHIGLADKEVGQALSLLVSSKEAQELAGEMYALESSNCYRCHRTLTVPASIHRGLGPDCAQKIG